MLTRQGMDAVTTDLLSRYPDLGVCAPAINDAIGLLEEAFRAGRKLLICGNGGSAADADHLVGELMKSFCRRRPISDSLRSKLVADGSEGARLAESLQGALPAISLSAHGAFISAFANDDGFEAVFAQQVLGYGQPGDVLLAISTSGSSPNVVAAVRVAKALDLRVIALCGEAGGLIAPLSDTAICVPASTTAAVQELHLPIYHAIARCLEERLFPA